MQLMPHRALRAASMIRQAEISPVRILYLLNKVLGPSVDRAHQQTQARATLLRKINEYAENGVVAVMWSGRDCDGVVYSGAMRLCTANIKAFDRHVSEELASADGPCRWKLMRPSTAINVPYLTRDAAAEAHENGHRHILFA